MAPKKIQKPELFFCLCAPVGVDLNKVSEALEAKLRIFGYKSVYIKLTSLLSTLDDKLPRESSSLFKRYEARINSANKLRRKIGPDVMAATSVFQIRDERYKISRSHDRQLRRLLT